MMLSLYAAADAAADVFEFSFLFDAIFVFRYARR
jgi:hypothetical protein